MNFTFKKALLAGTAIVAVAALAPAANAATLTLTGAAVWGTDGGNGMLNTPTAGDNVVMSTHNLQIDTSEVVVLTAGAITSTTGDLSVNTTGNAQDLTFTIGSFTGSSTADITVDNLNASTNRNVTFNSTGAVSTAGNVLIRNTETGGSNTSVVMNVGGNFTVSGAGTTDIETTGTGQTNTTAELNLNGATNTFAGAVTVTGGADDASNEARLLISGATTTFTGGLTLTNGAAGHAVLRLDGLTAAQTVNGTIAGDGDIIVQNAAGVRFNGTVTSGTIVIENGAGALNSSATFRDDVTAAITLGTAGTGTNTVTFDGTTAGYAVNGAINGGAAGENNIIRVIGGNTIQQAAGTWAGNIDSMDVTGTGTILNSDAAITTTGAITIGSGAKIDAAAVLTAAGGIANAGTLQLTNNVTHAANITGSGLLDVDSAVTINGAITQGTADIAGVTLTQSGGTNAYNVGTTNFSGAGTLGLAAGNKTVTGNFTNTTAGQGTITIANGAGTTAFVGNLGQSSTDQLLALTLGGGNTQTVTTTGNLHVATTTLDDADVLQFIGTSPQFASGAIRGAGATDGVITVGNGGATDVTFSGVVGGGGNTIGSSTVSANATARYNANATYSGTYTNTGTTVVGSGAVVSADTLTNTGAYVLKVVDTNGTLATADFGSLTDNNGGASTITNSRLSVNVTGNIGTGANILLLTNVNAGAGTLVDNSIQYRFVTVNDGADTDVTVTRQTAQALATTQNDGVAATLEGLNASTNGPIATIVDNLAKASTQDAFNEVLESAGPTVDGGAVVGGFNASMQSINVSNTRLASLRNGVETGMVAGETGNGLQGWVQGFGQAAEQDRRDNVDGYEADTYGMAVGLDTADILNNGTVGVALSYADTEVDSANANRTNAEIDSYQVSVYGDYDVAPQTYIAGTLGFAWNDISQTRFNVGGAGGPTASAEYDSNQYIAYMEAGREFNIANNTTLTPHVLAHYQHISIDDYTETGVGANLNVDNEDLDIFELGVGAELAWDLDGGDGSRIRPAINAGYRHDLVGDEVSTTSNFTGGGASFNTNGMEPAQGTFNIGAGLTYSMDNNWTFTADYDYELKSDYDAHSGLVRAGYKF